MEGGTLGSSHKGLLSAPRLARGCELCFPGAKAVIFITGVCDDSCYYCPVSRDKLGHDVMYVNEERVDSVDEVVVEVARSGADGASITGGDPLISLDRVTEVIRSLKENLGWGFHIHLYTSGRYAYEEALRALWDSGLDEIRFHPTRPEFLDRIRLARRATGMAVGAEIPIAPGMEGWAIKVVKAVEEAGGDFVNLNEMEIVEPNAESLASRGYRESPERPFTVEGSMEAAYKVVEWASSNSSIPVHFCPAGFKDRVQTAHRFLRQARIDRLHYESVTREGTLRWVEIRTAKGGRVVRKLAEPPDSRELAEALRLAGEGAEAWIVEAHPTRAREPVVFSALLRRS